MSEEAEHKTGITKDMTFGEIVRKHPETIEVMFSYGLHCVGCHVAAFETVEQGAKAHGMDDQTIKEMIEKMNEVTAKS
jgi:hybrid cluster-associated redox disulfide protein